MLSAKRPAHAATPTKSNKKSLRRETAVGLIPGSFAVATKCASVLVMPYRWVGLRTLSWPDDLAFSDVGRRKLVKLA
jgi:hypothetical protein